MNIQFSTEKQLSAEKQLSFLLALPEEYESQDHNWPLVVFLHGAGERGMDISQVLIHGIPKEAAEGMPFPFLLLAPQCPEETDWYLHLEAVMQLIERTASRHRVDTRRIYLTGISMGGFGVWQLAMQYPAVFAALIPVCGGGMPWRANRVKGMPVWVFHGAKDEVIPLFYSQNMVEALEACATPVKFTVYPEAGHDSWTETFQNPAVYEWMLSQAKEDNNWQK
jgi:predicted peptidase